MEMEEQRRQELQMARELAEKEDENLMLNEQYSSLQDEVGSCGADCAQGTRLTRRRPHLVAGHRWRGTRRS